MNKQRNLHSKSIDCIIVAAGTGKRLGAKTPKAFVRLADRPLFVHSFMVFAAHQSINRIILVVPSTMINKACSIVNKYPVKKQVTIIAGGTHRWQSVKNGVEASQAEWVMIHDSARPFITRAIVEAVLAAAEKYDAVIAATPEVDTIRRFSGDRAGETLDRNGLVRVQTPQLFRRAGLTDAFRHSASLLSPPTDEAMLMEAAGIPVALAQGNPLNFKITTKEDFRLAEALLKSKKKVKH
jgi:2-C-methyl-D-erythritol 4-phosphate cytidylyltransferase